MAGLISVLLPVFNAQQFLADCLRSIQNQSYADFEVVIVDDGSGDDTPLILDEFRSGDERFRVITLPENRGIVAALNRGIQSCRADWIARMDADDIMRPDRLQLQKQHIAENPEIDILGARVRIFRDDGELTAGQKRYQEWSNSLLTHEEICREIFAESPIMHPTFFLRREYLVRLGGYIDNPWAEVYDFLLRALMAGGRFAKLPEILVEKRDSPARLARVDDRCKRRAMFAAKAHYFARLQWHDPDRPLLLVGSGSSGRIACAALRKVGVAVHGFADNVPGESGRRVAGLPAYTLDYHRSEPFFNTFPRPQFLLCIGIPQDRRIMEELLHQCGFQAGVDYLRFI